MEELAFELFSSKKLKYLNLQEVKGVRSKEDAKKEFVKFVKSISKAVFLSAEGVYSE